MLNSVEWKYFKLEDLFKINLGKHKKKEDLSLKPIKTHNIPYITSSSMNNGVDGYSSESNAKNVITIGTRGSNFAFYHKDDIFASGNVAILQIKNSSIKMNEYKALFITVIINNEQYRWSYGFNPTLTRLRRIDIKLPVDSNGDPNWEFMEEYMKEISKGNLEGFNLPKNDTRLSLDEREWDEFKLEDLFEINGSPNTTSKIARELIDSEINNINYVTRRTYNNGVGFRLNKSKTKERDIPINKGKVIIVGAESTESFYQEEDFITGNKISILKNSNLNKYNGIFISTLIDKEFYRYSYGRGLTLGRLKNVSIKLPIKPKSSPDEKSEPDWEFMENYIKGLPYTNKL